MSMHAGRGPDAKPPPAPPARNSARRAPQASDSEESSSTVSLEDLDDLDAERWAEERVEEKAAPLQPPPRLLVPSLVAYARHRFNAVVNSSRGTMVLLAVTLYALYGDDLRLSAFPPSADPVFEVLSSITFFVFAIELICNCALNTHAVCGRQTARGAAVARGNWLQRAVGVRGYVFCFAFWLDTASTISVLGEVWWLWIAITGSEGGASGLAAARAGRISRVGSKAGRLLRMARLVRLLKFYKVLFGARASGDEGEVEEAGGSGRGGMAAVLPQPSRVGLSLSNLTVRRVALGVIAMVIAVPLLRQNEEDRSPEAAVDALHRASVAAPAANVITAFDAAFADRWEDEPFLLRVKMDPPRGGGDLDRTPLATPLRTGLAGLEALLVSVTTGPEVRNVTGNGSVLAASAPCPAGDAACGPQAITFTTEALFNERPRVQAAARRRVLLVLFVMILLLAGAMAFSNDATRLVLMPLEHMVFAVRDSVRRPLRPLHSRDNTGAHEARTLENAVKKINGSLAAGLGPALVHVAQTAAAAADRPVTPLVPPRPTFCVVVAVRPLRAITIAEGLRGELPSFMNALAQVVHRCSLEAGGMPAAIERGYSMLITWTVPHHALERLYALQWHRIRAKRAQLTRADDTGEEEKPVGGSHVHIDPLPRGAGAAAAMSATGSASEDVLASAGYGRGTFAELERELAACRGAGWKSQQMQASPNLRNLITQRIRACVSRRGPSQRREGDEEEEGDGEGDEEEEKSATSDSDSDHHYENARQRRRRLHRARSRDCDRKGGEKTDEDGPSDVSVGDTETHPGSKAASGRAGTAAVGRNKDDPSRKPDSGSVAPRGTGSCERTACHGVSELAACSDDSDASSGSEWSAESDEEGRAEAPDTDPAHVLFPTFGGVAPPPRDAEGMHVPAAVRAVADRALMACVRMITRVARDGPLRDALEDAAWSDRAPGLRPRLSIGVHAGWTMSAGQGSPARADAVLLGRAVEVARAMDRAAPHYGSQIALSGSAHALLSPRGQRVCRHVDTVRIRTDGDAEAPEGPPHSVFVCDAWDPSASDLITLTHFEPLWDAPDVWQRRHRAGSSDEGDASRVSVAGGAAIREHPIARRRYTPSLWRRDADLIAARLHAPRTDLPVSETGNGSVDDIGRTVASAFARGRRAFARGRWALARDWLTRAQRLSPHHGGDGPSRALLAYMDRCGNVPPPDWDGVRSLDSVTAQQ